MGLATASPLSFKGNHMNSTAERAALSGALLRLKAEIIAVQIRELAEQVKQL